MTVLLTLVLVTVLDHRPPWRTRPRVQHRHSFRCPATRVQFSAHRNSGQPSSGRDSEKSQFLNIADKEPRPLGANAGNVNYIIVELQTRQILKQDWPDADNPIPVGSLVKPFTALAASGPLPQFFCRGAIDQCWLKKGHGTIQFREALADSCNAYFLQLARNVDAHSLAVVAAKFGIPPPSADTPEARIGLGKDWEISPLALTRAYCELTSRAAEPRVAEILAGLKRAAESGTASAIGRGALAKTGTAPCVAERKHKGDGFTIVLAPSATPRIAILVRVHGVPGAEAAKSASLILQREVR